MSYILVLFVGVAIGIVLMRLLQVNREQEREEYVQDIRQLSYCINTRVNQAEVFEPEKVAGMKEVQKIHDYYLSEELQ